MATSLVRQGSTMGLLLAPFERCLAYRGILARTTWMSLVGTYAGSVLGMSWLVVGQILLLSVYVLTYVVIFKIQPANMTVVQYVLYVFAGIVPFLAFSASLTNGASALSSDRQIFLNTVFPSELLPVRSTLIASASLPIGLALVVVGTFIWGTPSPALLFVPVVIVLQLMFQCGLAWLLSLVTLILRDIRFALQYITMTLMIITPIAYTPEMAPGIVKSILYINPLSYFVIANQSLIVYGTMPSLGLMTVMVAMSLVTFVFGFWVFERAKMTFFDYA